jgi:hypothetical protein
VSPLGRVVATGSGLVTLLNSFRTAHVNGFALWDVISFLSVGREPSPIAARHIAAAILPPYAASWPYAAKLAITPKTLMNTLASTAQSYFTSLRPALLAYTLSCMGDAKWGTPDTVVNAALNAAIDKLHFESTRDTLAALVALTLEQRRVLREVATGAYTVAELEAIQIGRVKSFKNANVGVSATKLAALITCLREEGAGTDIVRLQPPYSILLESWVRSNGELAVAVHNDEIDLDFNTRMNLVFIAESRSAVLERPDLLGRAGVALMESLARNGVGVQAANGTWRPPGTAAELDATIALQVLSNMLHADFAPKGRWGPPAKEPSLSVALKYVSAAAAGAMPMSAAGAAPFSDAHFHETVGWKVLLAFRHFHSHIWSSTEQLVRNGLTASVVADAVSAAAHVLAEPVRGCFILVDARLLPKPAASEGRHNVTATFPKRSQPSTSNRPSTSRQTGHKLR